MAAVAAERVRQPERRQHDRHIASIALAAIAAAVPLGLLLRVQLGGSTTMATSLPAARVIVATTAISIVGVLAMPTMRSLAPLAAIHVALLALIGLASEGATATGTSLAATAHAWLSALAQAWLGSAAVIALGHRMQERALRRRVPALAMGRLPAIADARRLLGILMVAAWLTCALANLLLGALALAMHAPSPTPASALVASLATLTALSILLITDAVRGSSARQRAHAALLVYAFFLASQAVA